MEASLDLGTRQNRNFQSDSSVPLFDFIGVTEKEIELVAGWADIFLPQI
jgi:hypothetical protein